MAVQQPPVTTQAEPYNYATFTTSEARGKSAAFRSIARVGEGAPDFSLPTPEGEHVRLSEFRGQEYVVLEFGAIT